MNKKEEKDEATTKQRFLTKECRFSSLSSTRMDKTSLHFIQNKLKTRKRSLEDYGRLFDEKQ